MCWPGGSIGWSALSYTKGCGFDPWSGTCRRPPATVSPSLPSSVKSVNTFTLSAAAQRRTRQCGNRNLRAQRGQSQRKLRSPDDYLRLWWGGGRDVKSQLRIPQQTAGSPSERSSRHLRVSDPAALASFLGGGQRFC